MKKTKGLPAFVGVGCVWIGTHFGPGFASGAQMNIYYVKYGVAGLFMPLIAMLILGAALYFTVEYSRLNKLHNFNVYVNSLYAPFNKIMSPLFDFCYLFTVLCALGSCLASVGSLLESFVGIPYWGGIALIIAIIMVMCIFGSNIVRIVSSYMMFIVMGIILLIFILSFTVGDPDMSGAIANSATNFPEASFGKALWSAIIYASFQATIICNICSVTDTLESRKESKKSIIFGYAGNVIMMLLAIVLLFSYTNVYDITSETLPFYSVLARMNMKWLTVLYVILVMCAVVSTGVGFMYSGIARYEKYIKIKNEKLRGALIAIVLMVACACAASFGLTALVSKGFSILGYLNMPIMIIPALFVASYKISKKYRQKKGLPVEE